MMRELDHIEATGIAYSICSLVSDLAEYGRMHDSFVAAGFTEDDCEYIYINNSVSNKYDAYEGLNRAITASRGERIILCHQDLLMHFDDRAVLETRLAELDRLDPQWAVAGNCGGSETLGTLHVRLTDPHEKDLSQGPFPQRVSCLDENFVLLKRDANLGFSANLSGFHMYGTDLCLQANTRGRTCYVIDFHLEHLSPGNADGSFREARERLLDKYQRAFSDRCIQTSCTRMYLSGNASRRKRFNTKPMMKLIRKMQHLVKGKTPRNRPL